MKMVLFSGGVDSATCLAMAKEKDPNTMAVSIDYGQRHNREELLAAEKIAEYYKVPLRKMNLTSIFSQGKSSLTDLKKHVSMGDYSQQEAINTEVEFRNGVFLSILTSLAMQYQADEVYFGAHQDDSGTIYPDCSPEFVNSMAQAIKVGSHGEVHLTVPFLYKTKTQVVEYGKSIGVPYKLTYSCYMGTRPPCGKCGTCIERNKAFVANGLDFD